MIELPELGLGVHADRDQAELWSDLEPAGAVERARRDAIGRRDRLARGLPTLLMTLDRQLGDALGPTQSEASAGNRLFAEDLDLPDQSAEVVVQELIRRIRKAQLEVPMDAFAELEDAL
jgi:hypothetical protein